MAGPTGVSLRPGFWCVAQVRSVVTGAVVAGTGMEAATVTGAFRLVRVGLRTLTPALSRDEAARAFAWLELGQWEAVHRLRQGGELALAFQYQDREVQWRIRPVLFLTPPPRTRSPTAGSPCWRSPSPRPPAPDKRRPHRSG